MDLIKPRNTLSRIKARQGLCYELAYRILLEEEKDTAWNLVHGFGMCGPNRTYCGHAVLFSGDVVYCPTLNGSFPASEYFEKWDFKPIGKYSFLEAVGTLLSERHYGPWPPEIEALELEHQKEE